MRPVRLLASLPLLAVVAGMAIAQLPTGPRLSQPFTIELRGCVEPTPDCDSRDVIDMRVLDESRKFAASELTVVTGSEMRGRVLNDLTARPVRVQGPREQLDRLVAGKRLRVRAQRLPGQLVVEWVREKK